MLHFNVSRGRPESDRTPTVRGDGHTFGHAASLCNFASGAIPGTEVQKLALAAGRDRYGRDNGLSRRLAPACRWGHQAGNIFRHDLKAADRAGPLKETNRLCDLNQLSPFALRFSPQPLPQ